MVVAKAIDFAVVAADSQTTNLNGDIEIHPSFKTGNPTRLSGVLSVLVIPNS